MRDINLRYVEERYDESGIISRFGLHYPADFNFGYDIAAAEPDRRAMVWCNPEGEEHTFTFGDMKRWSDKTANYLASLGIGRGDMVMVILRRHYQFWFVATALHKLGAVMIPATFMLKEHDLTYRLQSAGVKALICTSVGEIAATASARRYRGPAGSARFRRSVTAGTTSTPACARRPGSGRECPRSRPTRSCCTSPRAPRATPRWCSTTAAMRSRTSSRPSTGTTW